MKEYCERWEPSGKLKNYGNFPVIYDIEYFLPDGLAIKMSDMYGKRVSFVFANGVWAQRGTEESLRLRPIALPLEYSVFFKVINSSYIKWLSEKSGDEIDFSQLTHFVFAGSNLILDVVAGSEPSVEFIN